LTKQRDNTESGNRGEPHLDNQSRVLVGLDRTALDPLFKEGITRTYAFAQGATGSSDLVTSHLSKVTKGRYALARYALMPGRMGQRPYSCFIFPYPLLTGKRLLTYTTYMVRRQEDLQVDVFHAISDPTRRSLLDLVAVSEQPVKTLAKAFAMTRPAISQHLRILKDAGLVIEKKVGREHLYRLHAVPLHEVSDWVQQYERFWRNRLDMLGEQLDNMP